MIAAEDDLYDPSPRRRLEAAQALKPKVAAKLRQVPGWPALSPAAVNAWLLMVTQKPPSWRDDVTEFAADPPTVGEMHPGWLYYDPLGFWGEARRWAVELLRRREPGWGVSEALAVSALVHLGEEPQRLRLAMTTCRPGMVLFLDEPAWQAAGWEVSARLHHVPDPHRDGQVYQGFWGRRPDGLIVGKSPQHPTMHRLYDDGDMREFLHAAPRWRAD